MQAGAGVIPIDELRREIGQVEWHYRRHDLDDQPADHYQQSLREWLEIHDLQDALPICSHRIPIIDEDSLDDYLISEDHGYDHLKARHLTVTRPGDTQSYLLTYRSGKLTAKPTGR